LKNPWILIATFLGVGFSPIIPGTAGTLAAIPLYIILHYTPVIVYIIAMFVIFGLGVYSARKTDAVFGSSDNGIIVIDEVLGYLVTMAFIPFSFTTILMGFFLFRFFDIVKIQPARYFDKKVKNAYGVMLDDVAAGIYANFVLRIICIFFSC